MLTAMMTWSSVGAIDVQIYGFNFGCQTPDGELRKPKFGDVDGIFFTNLPAERKACLETIDRMIYSCNANTTFISHDLNSRYPSCLGIFERQAQECVVHIEGQRQKCYAGGSSETNEVKPVHLTMWATKRSNIRSGPGTEHAKVGLLEIGDEVQVTGEIGNWLRIEARGDDAFVYAPLLTENAPETGTAASGADAKDESDTAVHREPDVDQPAAVSLEPKCPKNGTFQNCWFELQNPMGCHFWISEGIINRITWSGSCSGGVAQGEGVMSYDESTRGTGAIADGKKQGRWIFTNNYDNGDSGRSEGDYLNGNQHGLWRYVFKNNLTGKCQISEMFFSHGEIEEYVLSEIRDC